MSKFNHHYTVVEDYRDFVRSFFTVADNRARYQRIIVTLSETVPLRKEIDAVIEQRLADEITTG